MAARAVFAEQGVDAQMDDVARHADVGVGTVYRHFPTKEALLNALSDELFAVIAVHTRTLLTLEDPWEAFTRALWFGAEKTAGDRAFTEIMAAQRKWPAAHLSRQGGPARHGRRADGRAARPRAGCARTRWSRTSGC